MELEFEWDEKKNHLNQMKHGVSFEVATEVFYDRKCLELYNGKHSLFEDRWTICGLSSCSLLLVVFTERGGVIRIISARKASKKEEEDLSPRCGDFDLYVRRYRRTKTEDYYYGYGKI